LAKKATRATKSEGVHAVWGADSFLAEQGLESVLSSWVGSERGDSVEVLRGDEATWAQVLDVARTGSLFAERRAVVVRDAEALEADEEQLGGVEAYLDSPTPGLALVLLIGKADKRRRPWKWLAERGRVIPADPLKGRALQAQVREELRRRQLRVGDDGVQELVDRVGQNLRRLMGEIDKLEAFGLGGEAISAEQVAAVLGRGIARPLYKMSDAMVERRTTQVLELMSESLEEGEAPLRVLGTLHRTLRQVRGAAACREAGLPGQELTRRLGVLPFKVGDLMRASGGWTEADLRRAMAAFGQADHRLKSGGVDPRVALTAAVVEALGGGG
jgi:DNA polymerase-3 subunit delta